LAIIIKSPKSHNEIEDFSSFYFQYLDRIANFEYNSHLDHKNFLKINEQMKKLAFNYEYLLFTAYENSNSSKTVCGILKSFIFRNKNNSSVCVYIDTIYITDKSFCYEVVEKFIIAIEQKIPENFSIKLNLLTYNNTEELINALKLISFKEKRIEMEKNIVKI